VGSVASNGFELREAGKRRLVARSDQRDALIAAGLDRPEAWERLLDSGRHAAGRGSTVRVELDSGLAVRLKRMRRGGLAAGLWRDRFVGQGRLVDNLRVPSVALERGVATAAPVALLMAQGPPGLWRAWVAVEELDGARDLRALLTSDQPLSRDELAAVMRVVRGMHDAGVHHPDLNLGNLLLRRDSGEAFVIDLDRGRLVDGPLPFGLRQRELRRLERSWVKELGAPSLTGGLDADLIYENYAEDDDALASRLRAGRPFGRFLLRLHALSWRR